MKISFHTKEQSNEIQLERFLKLSKTERIYGFIDLILKGKKLPKKEIKTESNNFLIEIKFK